MELDDREKIIFQRLKDDFPHYASRCLKIRPKEGVGLENFKLNKAQLYIHQRVEQQKRETGKIRAIILKGRQQGCSTYIEGRFYWLVTHYCGIRAFILTHDNSATNNLFEMAKRYHEHCPELVQPKLQASNSKELIFADLDSGYKIGTAGNKNVGRSSTIQLLHGSEAGFWPNAPEIAAGLMQAVPSLPGTEIFIESTANGIGNYFHELWQMAETGGSDFLPIFVPWFWQSEYTKEVKEDFVLEHDEEELMNLYGLSYEQLNWRRAKIIEHSAGGQNGLRFFNQEYPCNPIEAFQTSGEGCFIPPPIVIKARKSSAERYGPLIIGCDPARGRDRTSIIRRQGRRAFGLESYLTDNTMEITGRLHKIIEEENPFKVCIDIVGIGAGVYDRLKELGHSDILVPVMSGETAFDKARYANKRAEMWDCMKQWLMDSPCQIPDEDSLHADLCNIEYKIRTNNQLLMESKDNMKSRGIRSPDEADALAFTFAVPDSALRAANTANYSAFGAQLLADTNKLDRLRKRAYAR